MSVRRRWTIHVPQLVGRISYPQHGEEAQAASRRLVGEFDTAMQELQRFLRYLQDSTDDIQTDGALEFRADSSVIGTQRAINFIDTAEIEWIISNDPVDGEVEIRAELGPGAVQMKQTELTFGPPAVVKQVFVVVDSDITPASLIEMMHSGAAATGKQADEAEFDAIDCRCEPLAGSFRVYATSLLGHVVGAFKFNYVARS
jgi:hypothetical protein